jgi:exopolysaccharide biosynthesis polyprenyl glycosylphosphotransferase
MFSELIKRHKLGIAFLGDIIVFFLSMTIVLYCRYGNTYFVPQFSVHLEPFLIVLFLWLVIFYIANLYTYKAFGNIIEIAKRVSVGLAVSFSVTITIFYIFSRFFELTPKANLIMLTITFGVLDILWRYILRKVFIKKSYRSNILTMAASPLIKEVGEYVNGNPQLGYSLYPFNGNMATLADAIRKYSITQVVIDGKFFKNNAVTKLLYGILSKQIEITTLTDFYESLFGCIPIEEIEEEWFVREIAENKSIYESMKRLIEIVIIIFTLPITIPLGLIISCLIAATSRGPIIFKQERVGKNDKPFILYKFRTMIAVHDGPLWTCEDDDRITFIGKFLRHTHLDELPQLFNVIRDDISFIGPRPERTKLAKMYEQIPYYEIRHIIKPGIVGWAQLNYKPSASIDEAKKKFQFDLYYIKNRSFVLDLFILLKTARTLFVRNK